MIKLKEKMVLFSSLALSLADKARAEGWVLPDRPQGLAGDFNQSIENIINWLLEFVAALSILVIIYGGVVYIASSGDKARVTQAKDIIKYALMGLIMAGVAFAAVRVVVTTIH